MPANKLVMLFDLDETLIHMPLEHEAALCIGQQHLTETNIDGKTIYFIYQDKMKQILEYILNNSQNIILGFITAGKYPKDFILHLFNEQYGLNFTDDILFVNGNDYGDQRTPKADKINSLIEEGFIDEKSPVVLVDDNIVHVKSAISAGFLAIRAKGHSYFKEENSGKLVCQSCKDYLLEIDATIRRYMNQIPAKKSLSLYRPRCNSL